jgi:hypothetical protein
VSQAERAQKPKGSREAEFVLELGPNQQQETKEQEGQSVNLQDIVQLFSLITADIPIRRRRLETLMSPQKYGPMVCGFLRCSAIKWQGTPRRRLHVAT